MQVEEAVPRRPRFKDALRAFHYRNFTLFWVGAVLSNSGTWMQNIAVPFVVFEATGSPAWVGIAVFMQLLPIVIFGPVGGWIADRFPRRRVLLATQSLAVLEAIGLWLVWIRGGSVPVLLGLVSVGGVITGLSIPSWQAFISELVPREVLLNAVTLNSTQFNAARAVGPMVGGVVLGTFGPGAAFLINAVSYVAVIGALILIRLDRSRARPTSEQPRRILGDFFDAARETRRFPGIRACFIAVAALGALGSPLWSLLVVFAKDVFSVGPTGYGFLQASLGIGSVIAAPVIAGPGSGSRRSTLLLASMLLYGTAIAVFGMTSVYAVGVVVLVVSSAGYLGIAATLNTTIQLQVPEAIRGKVLALYVMLLTFSAPVGALAQGAAADRWGAPITVVVAGVCFLAVTVWLWQFSGLLAHVDDGGQMVADEPRSRQVTDSVGVVELPPLVEEGATFDADTASAAPTAGGPGSFLGSYASMQHVDEPPGPVDGAGDRGL